MNEDVSIIALDEPMLPLIEDALSCDLCDFEPKNEKELKTHLESIHSITVKKKMSPHIGQKHLMNLEEHNHEDEIKTSTPNKDLKSNLDEEVEKYTKAKSRDRIECDKCDTTISCQEGLDKHLKEKHKHMNFYNCTTCEFKTTTIKDFEIHVETVHETENVNIKCEMCDDQFATIEELEKHKNNYHNLLQFKCGNCGKVCKDIEELKQHEKSMHDTSEPTKTTVTQYKCDTCCGHIRLLSMKDTRR